MTTKFVSCNKTKQCIALFAALLSFAFSFGQNCTNCTIFQSTTTPSSLPVQSDGQGLELGVKFQSTQSGFITGVRFYKVPGMSGTHSGSLWSRTGTRLAQATFISETTSGWQQVLFATPVAINANTTYVASFFSPPGRYVASDNFFATTATSNPPLRALANGEDGLNGIYVYSGTSAFPNASFQSGNYWVDVVFSQSGADNTPPTVAAVIPANNATNVAINSTVTANFSESMNAGTITATNVQLKAGATVITAALNITASQVILTPSAPLANNTVYTATIKGGSTGVKDLAGNALASDYNWSFTTAAPADVTPPTVTTVVPANTTIGVAINTTVTIGFSEAMNASTVTGTTVQLKNGATIIPTTRNVTSTQVVLTPSSPLNFSTTYTLTVTGGASGVKDLAGNALAANFTSGFTTAAPADVTPPSVTVVSPVNGATGVAFNTVMTATFSEQVNTSTVTASTVQLKNGSMVIPAALTITPTQVTLTPSAALAAVTVYTVTITGGASGVKDQAGNPLASNYTWSFTTSNAPDVTAPFIASTIPASGAVGVPLNISPIVLNFSEAMDPESGGLTFDVQWTGGWIAGTASIVSPSQVTFLPAGPLLPSTTYTAFFDRTVRDLAGNQLTGPFFWSFTTATAVTSVTPANGATGISNTVVATINLVKPLNAATVTDQTVLLKKGTTVIPAVLTVSSSQITLTPVSPLDNLTLYTITIKSGSAGIKDIDNSPLAEDYTWSFTTAAGSDVTAPVVTILSPASNATNVAINATVSASFNEAMNTATINAATVQLKNGATVISSALNVTSTQVVLTPSAPLSYSTVYTVVIKGGASGVKDLAGNAAVNDLSWTFTTRPAPDITPPAVISISPPNGANSVSINNPVIVINFSEPVTGFPQGVPDVSVTSNRGGFFAPETEMTTPSQLTIRLLQTVSNSTEFTVELGHVLDLAGNGLIGNTPGGPYVTKFTTQSAITTVTPSNGATGVSANSAASATFSAAIDAATITNANVQLKNGSTVVPASLSVNGALLTITPSAPLANATLYTITISGGAAGVKDIFGDQMGADYTWSFTAGSSDITPPTVITVSPANGVFNVPINTTVSANFNESINPSTLTVTTVQLKNGTTVVPATLSSSATQVILTPSSPLTKGILYTVTITGGINGVKDLAGNPLASDYTWNFNTVPPPDNTPPTVVLTVPASGATNVSVNPTITVNFSEAVLGGETITMATAGGVNVPVNATQFSNTQAVITPQGTLAYGTTYTVTIPGTGVTDYNLNRLGPDYVWSFTTLTQPSVTTVTPSNGATGIAVNSTVTASFNQAMNTSTITGTTVQLRNGSTVIPATLNVTSTQLTLTPSSPLSYSTVYTITITGGPSGVKDVAGSPIAANYNWSFTTAAAPATTTTTIFQSSTSPAGLSPENDGSPIELGLKFRSTQSGYITAIRFYKNPGVTGAHSGSLWTSTGTRLGQVTFTETASGWQQASFASPVAINANTTYVASFFSSSGDYVSSNSLTAAVVNSPLRALANGEDGPNGLYRYTATSAFPNANFQSSNYWVDVVYAAETGPDVTPPVVSTTTPANGNLDIIISAPVTVNFNEPVSAASITAANVSMKDAADNVVAATLNVSSNVVTLTATAPLTNSTVYTVTVKGGTTGVKDASGNSLAADYIFSFTTSAPMACAINGSITTTFNSSTIPSGRYIWFNAAFDPGTLPTTGGVTFLVTSNVITFTANSVQYTINAPDSKIRFDANVSSATTSFVNNRWETAVPITFNSYAFLGGHAYQVPANLPGNIANATWTCKISIDRPNTSLTWRWSAAAYTSFTINDGIQVKPVNGSAQNPYNNSDNAGAPQNTQFRSALVSGAKTTGGTNYTGTYSTTSTATCSAGALRVASADQLITVAVTDRDDVNGLQVRMTPNPASTYFTALIRSNDNSPVILRIIDITGRVVERHEKLPGNTAFQFGHKLKAGIYFAEVIQGEMKRVVKVIKVE